MAPAHGRGASGPCVVVAGTHLGSLEATKKPWCHCHAHLCLWRHGGLGFGCRECPCIWGGGDVK